MPSHQYIFSGLDEHDRLVITPYHLRPSQLTMYQSLCGPDYIHLHPRVFDAGSTVESLRTALTPLLPADTTISDLRADVKYLTDALEEVLEKFADDEAKNYYAYIFNSEPSHRRLQNETAQSLLLHDADVLERLAIKYELPKYELLEPCAQVFRKEAKTLRKQAEEFEMNPDDCLKQAQCPECGEPVIIPAALLGPNPDTTGVWCSEMGHWAGTLRTAMAAYKQAETSK